MVYASQGDADRLITAQVESEQRYKKQLLRSLPIMHETALADYQRKYDQSEFTYSATLRFPRPALAGQSYNNALFTKGLSLLAAQNLQRLLAQSTDTVVTQLYGQYRIMQNRLSRLYASAKPQRSVIDSLERKAVTVQQEFLQRLPAYQQTFNALNVEWPQVQQKLGSTEAAIEFITFPFWNNRQTDSVCYAAILVRPGWVAPKFVYLGEQKQLAALVTSRNGRQRTYVNWLYGMGKQAVTASGLPATGSSGEALFTFIWKPLDSLLTGVNRISYAPSGLLHRLNMAALPIGNNKRLGDRYTLTLLASTRQVAVPETAPPVYGRSALLMGGIRYDFDSTAYTQINQPYHLGPEQTQYLTNRSTPDRGGGWNPLVETKVEIQNIARLLGSKGYQVDSLLGWRASEEAFYHYATSQKTAPRLIHFATHGFFYDRAASGKDVPAQAFRQSGNTLIRSGLVLSGANRAWKGDKPLAGYEDGILTAYEISYLNLQRTELVVLSACETGLGDIQGSEGVYGLQRAFKIAGVNKLIMSLWQVPDSATRGLMEAFYRYYLQDHLSIRQAFDQATADRRRTNDDPYLWAGFVLIE